jgi:hypothetical protein
MDITNRSDVNSLAEAQSNTANSLLENCKTADSSQCSPRKRGCGRLGMTKEPSGIL